MEFTKYSSLENHYRQQFINRLYMSDEAAETWVATEKVHGANFSMHYNGTDFKYAKRTGWVEQGEKFYNCRKVVEFYKDLVIELQYLISNAKQDTHIAVYGELYGGGGGDDAKVQKGVEYCPGQDFIAFDILVDGEYLAWNDVVALCAIVGIPTVPELGRGSLREMLEMNNKYQSVIPELHGHNVEGENIAEGLVIRPASALSRAFVKSKNDLFSESKQRAEKTPKPPVTLSDDMLSFYEEFTGYINENRLNAVVSKIGALTHKDFGRVSGALLVDALDDMAKDFEQGSPKAHFGDDWKPLQKVLTKYTMDFLRKDWLNTVDSTN